MIGITEEGVHGIPEALVALSSNERVVVHAVPPEVAAKVTKRPPLYCCEEQCTWRAMTLLDYDRYLSSRRRSLLALRTRTEEGERERVVVVVRVVRGVRGGRGGEVVRGW